MYNDTRHGDTVVFNVKTVTRHVVRDGEVKVEDGELAHLDSIEVWGEGELMAEYGREEGIEHEDEALIVEAAKLAGFTLRGPSEGYLYV